VASYIYSDIHGEYAKLFKKENHLGECMGLGTIFCWLRELWDCRDGSRLLYHAHMSRDAAEEDILRLLSESLQEWLDADINLIHR